MSAWIDQIFEAATAENGNIVRRARADVEKYASVDELLAEVKKRGYHLVESGDQLVVICNEGLFKLHC